MVRHDGKITNGSRTKSKEYSNLCFKVGGGRLVRLLLCVDALFSRHGGVAKCRWNLPGTRKVCSRDPEEVQDDDQQGHDHTYGIEPKDIEVQHGTTGWKDY